MVCAHMCVCVFLTLARMTTHLGDCQIVVILLGQSTGVCTCTFCFVPFSLCAVCRGCVGT
jgi:hypothetical protein